MKASLYLVAIILLTAGNATAQSVSSASTLGTSSMHDIIDARSIALGEAMVARAGSEGAWNSNPATLAGIDGAGAHYGHRGSNQGIVVSDYYTAGVLLGTPAGVFAVNYNRFDLGEWQWTFENGASGGTVRLYDYTIALSYARNLLPGLSIGTSLKRFASVVEPISANTAGSDSKGAFYVDLGFLYSLPRNAGARDSLRVGIAVQNIGGDYESIVPSAVGVSTDQYRQSVARWLRVGLAYDMAILEDSSGPLLHGSITAEYRRFLKESLNYLGVGVEATIYDLVSLRLGAVMQPEDNIYGRKGKPALRYGIGLNLPLQKIGVNLPLTFGFDYARIPLSDSYVNRTGGSTAGLDDLDVIGVRVAYTAPIF